MPPQQTPSTPRVSQSNAERRRRDWRTGNARTEYTIAASRRTCSCLAKRAATHRNPALVARCPTGRLACDNSGLRSVARELKALTLPAMAAVVDVCHSIPSFAATPGGCAVQRPHRGIRQLLVRTGSAVVWTTPAEPLRVRAGGPRATWRAAQRLSRLPRPAPCHRGYLYTVSSRCQLRRPRSPLPSHAVGGARPLASPAQAQTGFSPGPSCRNKTPTLDCPSDGA